MARKLTLAAVKFLMIIAIAAFILTPRLFSWIGFSLCLFSALVVFVCLQILRHSDENEIRFRARKSNPLQ